MRRGCLIIIGCLFILGWETLAAQTRAEIDSVNQLPYDFMVSQPYQAVRVFKENVQKAQIIGYYYGMARAYERLHHSYFVLGKLDQSIQAALRAISLYDRLNALKDKARILGSYGYKLKGRNLQKARQIMQEALDIAEAFQFKEELAILYDDFGVLLEMEGNVDSALVFYQRALRLKEALNDTVGIPFSLNKIAGAYSQKGDFQKAREYMERSDAYRQQEAGAFGRAMNLVMWGDIYTAADSVVQAITYYHRAIQLGQTIGYKELVYYAYQRLMALYEKSGQYPQALQAARQYVAYHDSIVNETTQSRIAELEVIYETERREREIASKTLALQQKQWHLQLALLIGGGLVIGLLGVLGFLRYRQGKIRAALAMQNRLQRAEAEKRLMDEKLRISRELHDNIGARMTFLISSLDHIRKEPAERVETSLQELEQFGRETLNDLRHAVWSLSLEEGRLSHLILKIMDLKQHIAGQYHPFQIEVSNEAQTDWVLNSIAMLNLFRIIQEALQNSIKHAAASRIVICFREEGTVRVLEIRDNGRGFQPQEVSGGHGLHNMRRRCEQLGGTWQLDSGPWGTCITCRFPEHSDEK